MKRKLMNWKGIQIFQFTSSAGFRSRSSLWRMPPDWPCKAHTALACTAADTLR